MTWQRPTGLGTIVTICLSLVMNANAGWGAPPQTGTPSGWPEQVGGRKLHGSEYGFVYAREKSAVAQMQEVLATVTKDAQEDGVTTPPAGLVLVLDTKEKYPCAIAGLIEALKKTDPNESREELKALEGAEKQSQELGLDPNELLSVMPIPIRVTVLHEVMADFPADANGQIAWCAIVPTDACARASFKKIMDAGIAKEKPGLLKRAAIATMRPMVEHMMATMTTSTRQAVLYGLFLQAQKDLSPEQRKAKVEAYQEKLGLKKQKSDSGKEEEKK
jgi:hypothetical protein